MPVPCSLRRYGRESHKLEFANKRVNSLTVNSFVMLLISYIGLPLAPLFFIEHSLPHKSYSKRAGVCLYPKVGTRKAFRCNPAL